MDRTSQVISQPIPEIFHEKKTLKNDFTYVYFVMVRSRYFTIYVNLYMSNTNLISIMIN